MPGCSGQAWTAGTGISENICGTAETGTRRRNTTEYCKKGDILGVKGRVQTRTYENAEKEKRYVTEVVAEKVTFLSSRRGE